jgi:MFS family permease
MGFAAKPVGSIFLSKIGDLYGRKKVLFISILGMLLSTLLIGFSPSYAEIGWQATALLILHERFKEPVLVQREMGFVCLPWNIGENVNILLPMDFPVYPVLVGFSWPLIWLVLF